MTYWLRKVVVYEAYSGFTEQFCTKIEQIVESSQDLLMIWCLHL
jgi:hypothetical protein